MTPWFKQYAHRCFRKNIDEKKKEKGGAVFI